MSDERVGSVVRANKRRPTPNSPPSSPMAAVTVGKVLSFTDDEEARLSHLAKGIVFCLEHRGQGWRVLLVNDVTRMNKLIRAALNRSH